MFLIWVNALEETISLIGRYENGEEGVQEHCSPEGLAYDVFLNLGLMRRYASSLEEEACVLEVSEQLRKANDLLFQNAIQYICESVAGLQTALTEYWSEFEKTRKEKRLTERDDEFNAIALDIFDERDCLEKAFNEWLRAIPVPRTPNSQFAKELVAADEVLSAFDQEMKDRLKAFACIKDDVERVIAGLDQKKIPQKRYPWWYLVAGFQTS